MTNTKVYEENEMNFLHLKRKYGSVVMEEVKAQLIFCQHQKFEWQYVELEDSTTTHSFAIVTKECSWMFRIPKNDVDAFERFFLTKNDMSNLKRQNLLLNSIEK